MAQNTTPTTWSRCTLADFVQVHQEWHGWRVGYVRVADLEHVHWYQPPGAPRPLLHAYVDADKLLAGDVPRDPNMGRLLICLLKRDAPGHVYASLARQADANVEQ